MIALKTHIANVHTEAESSLGMILLTTQNREIQNCAKFYFTQIIYWLSLNELLLMWGTILSHGTNKAELK